MRRMILIAVAVLGLAGLGLGGQMMQAAAQSAPMDGPPHGPGGPPGRMGGDGPGWHHGPGMHGRMARMMGTFALLHPSEDRKLSGADVQKIAEGFLLWNGNHDWKIAGVAEQDERTVAFNIASPSGDVIAHFTMDRHSGRVTRLS